MVWPKDSEDKLNLNSINSQKHTSSNSVLYINRLLKGKLLIVISCHLSSFHDISYLNYWSNETFHNSIFFLKKKNPNTNHNKVSPIKVRHNDEHQKCVKCHLTETSLGQQHIVKNM